MDLKAYYLEYKNIPWYYGTCTPANTMIEARSQSNALWKQMCIREPVRIVVPALDTYEDLIDPECDDDDY